MSAAMRAAVLQGGRQVGLERAPLPQPGPREVRVRIEGCGVCASNLPVWDGRPWFDYPMRPGSPGHEGWGEVDSVGGEVDGIVPGQRVALLSGSAFAEYDIADAADVVALPEATRGRPMPAEPLACAMNILRRSDIQAGQTVAVVGTGFIGALLVQLAAAAGARVVVAARRRYAAEVAKRCGATEAVVSGNSHESLNLLREIVGSDGCERVIEAAGEQAALDIASGIVGEGGRLVIAGYHQDGLRQVNMQEWNWRGIDVVNAHERDQAVIRRGMREGIAAVADGTLDPFHLLTHAMPLDRLADAFELMQRRPDGFMKATVSP